MSIHQTKKNSDLEKRLTLLRRQVYGKQEFKIGNQSISSNPNKKAVLADSVYLYQDLIKIGIFTSLALGSQIILFFLLKNNVLNLNFI